MPRGSGGGGRPLGGSRPYGGYRPYRHNRGWYGGGWGYYPIFIDTDYSNEPEGTLCRRFVDGVWQKGRIINGTCVLGSHKFKESSADGESSVWKDCSGDRYSSFNPYVFSGTQQAQQIASQQSGGGGNWQETLNAGLGFASNLIGALGMNNKQKNVVVPPPPPPQKQGITVLGWFGIGAAVLVLGFITYKVAKK